MKSAKLKLIVIDDDEDYGRLFSEHCAVDDVACEWHESLEDLGCLALLGNFDAIVLDCNMEILSGVEIAGYVQTFFAKIPVVMISSSPESVALDQPWPACVKAAFEKSTGIERILDCVKQST